MRLMRIAVAALVAGAGLVSAAQPATAAPGCAVVRHSNTSGFTKAGSATATVVSDGVRLTTGTTSDADKVTWKRSFIPVQGSWITAASYRTIKLDAAGPNVNDAALPSYHIFIRINGQDSTLIYEPYWQTTGNPPRNAWTQWNVLTGKLWTNGTNVAGLPKTAGGPATKTFAEVLAANPTLRVTGVGIGLGTYNRGVISVVNNHTLSIGRACRDDVWQSRSRLPWWWGIFRP